MTKREKPAGSGRKPLHPQLPTVRVTVRLTEEQAAVFKLLGAAWLRAQLDQARNGQTKV